MSDGVTRKEILVGAAAGAAGLGAGAAAIAGLGLGLKEQDPPVLSGEILAVHTPDGVPGDNPGAGAWRAAQRVIVPLSAQQVAPPFLDRAGVDELRVSALHDGRELALRLEWDDRDLDDLDGIRRFHDAVAVQLPAKAGTTPPPITMGAPGAPVHILQWRATWQRDLTGKTGVDQIYPRVVHDVMPDDVLPPQTASLYWVGRAAGNPLSQRVRSTTIEEIVAEGFGSATHLGVRGAHGTGVYEGERWHVTIALPLAREGVAAPLEPGSSWPIAFAVWLGSGENRGGRKHFANWLSLRLETIA